MSYRQSQPPRAGHGARRVWRRVVSFAVLGFAGVFVAAWGCEPAWAQRAPRVRESAVAATHLRGAVVTARDSDTEQLLSSARTLLAAGRTDEGLLALQAANEASLGRGFVVERENPSGGPLAAPVFESATRAIRELLRSYSGGRGDDLAERSVLDRYRSQYEAPAAAMYQRARAERDVGELERCQQLYPGTRAATDAAITAGDFYLEAGDVEAAMVVWGDVDFQNLSLECSSSARALVHRWMLLASLTNRASLYADWSARLQQLAEPGEVVEAPKFLGASLVPSADGAKELPELPFRRGELKWRTFGSFEADGRASARRWDAPFLRQPGLGDSLFAVTLDRELRVFDLSTGKHRDEIEFPRTRSSGDSLQAEYFSEHDPCVRLQPLFAEGLIVSSYVARVNAQQKFMGYVIEEQIPRRALLVCHQDGGRSVLWTSEQCADPNVRELSFNSRPVVRGGRLYALGWRQAGFVEASLVCFDALNGSLQWTARLVANQVDLTMFGEISAEPVMGGVLYEDGVVYALTNLGALAAVRAQDGEPLWIMCYPANRPEPATQTQGTRPRRYTWNTSQLVSFPDRLVMTPLDSPAAIVVLKEDGTLIRSQTSMSGGRGPRHLVGRFHEYAVFTSGNQVRLAVGADLELDGQRSFKLGGGNIEAMPVLVDEGLVYSTANGLYYQPLVNGAATWSEIVGYTRSRGTGFDQSRSSDDGAVTVLKDAILVSNHRQVICFKAAPVEDQGPR